MFSNGLFRKLPQLAHATTVKRLTRPSGLTFTLAAAGLRSAAPPRGRFVKRTLLFDPLEDRRVLAGIDLFVFEDPLGRSGNEIPGAVDGVAGIVAYVDANRNGKLDSAEPHAITGPDGIATFRGLSPGEYEVSLLGDALRSHQVYPVSPASQGEWSLFGDSSIADENSKIHSVLPSGKVVALHQRQLEILSSLDGLESDRLDLGATIAEIALQQSRTTPLGANGSHQSQSSPDSQHSFEHILGVAKVSDGLDEALVTFEWHSGSGFTLTGRANLPVPIHSLSLVGDRVLGVDDSTGDLVEVLWSGSVGSHGTVDGPSNSNGADSEGGLSVRPIAATGSFIELHSSSGSLLFAKEGTISGDRISVYEVVGDALQLRFERTWDAGVEDWYPSVDGQRLYVSTQGHVVVYDVSSGLPEIARIADGKFPIFEDSDRGLVYAFTVDSQPLTDGTGSLSTESPEESSSVVTHPTLGVWRTGSWEQTSTFALPAGLSSGAMAFAQSGDYLVAVGEAGFYTHQVALPAARSVIVTEGVQTVAIGLRDVPAPEPVQIASSTSYETLEDTPLELSTQTLLRELLDSEQAERWLESPDQLRWVVVGGPSHGELTWDGSTGGRYVPALDYNGTDLVSLALFDGRSLSSPVDVSITVVPVNDPPRGISWSRFELPLSTQPNTVIAELNVDDPDEGDMYDFVVSDPRFVVLDSTLIYVGEPFEGTLDTELRFSITAVRRDNPEEKFGKSMGLKITPRDNSPVQIVLVGDHSIHEKTAGAIVSALLVAGAGPGASYRWTVSDERFEVSGGRLKLKSNQEVLYSEEPTVLLVVKAEKIGSTDRHVEVFEIDVIPSVNSNLDLVVDPEFSVKENAVGVRFGEVEVIGEGTSEDYEIRVNDNRFVVLAGIFQLREGASLQWRSDGIVNVVITAVSSLGEGEVSKEVKVLVERDISRYRNDANPADVDGDGVVTPLDPLIIINYINTHGPGIYIPEGEDTILLMDVDGDGAITPLDALIIINIINQNSKRLPAPSVPPDVVPGTPGSNNGGSGPAPVDSAGVQPGGKPDIKGEAEPIPYPELIAEGEEDDWDWTDWTVVQEELNALKKRLASL